jgi:hypothetical protein
MTGRPAAFKALALLSTAKVADSAIEPIRFDIREFAMGRIVASFIFDGASNSNSGWQYTPAVA